MMVFVVTKYFENFAGTCQQIIRYFCKTVFRKYFARFAFSSVHQIKDNELVEFNYLS